MRDRVIVCCSPFGTDWTWFVQELTAKDVRWLFYSDKARFWWQHLLQHPNFNTPLAGFLAALAAKRRKASLLVSVDSRLSLWCSLFCRMLGANVEHFIFSFNFPELPRGWKRKVFSFAFRSIDSIRVHSQMEVALYSEYFGIPQERIKIGLWCMNTPEVSPEQPLHTPPYVSAIGGNARDYQTLLAAAEQSPEIPMVWVVRPQNVAGMTIPANVKLVCDVPYGEAMNYLKHSQFMVLPLKGADVPCGHVTIVSAMMLHKALIATDSAGISDYVRDRESGLLCRPGDAKDLAEKIRLLWKDDAWSKELGDNGARFAETHCSEDRMYSEMSLFLQDRGLLREELVMAAPSALAGAQPGA